MGLLYRLTLCSHFCVCGGRGGGGGRGFWIKWFCDRYNHSQMVSYYRTNIINGVGHSRSDLVVSLVLCKVAYNI
jgi:hypothetical protein